MVEVLRETPFPLEGFIRQQPRAAVAPPGQRPGGRRQAGTGKRSGGVSAGAHYLPANKRGPGVGRPAGPSPWKTGATTIWSWKSLAYLAYDKSRSGHVPGLPISLERDGRFLRALLSQQGSEGLTRRLGKTFQVYGLRSADGQVDAGFLSPITGIPWRQRCLSCPTPVLERSCYGSSHELLRMVIPEVNRRILTGLVALPKCPYQYRTPQSKLTP